MGSERPSSHLSCPDRPARDTPRASPGRAPTRRRRHRTRPWPRRRRPRSSARCPRRSCARAGRGRSTTRVGAVGRLHHGQDAVAGTRTRWPRPSRSSTTRSTVATTPRRAAQAPQTPSSSGSEKTRLPAGSAAAACTSATSGTRGSSRPSGPNGESTTAKESLSAMDDPTRDPVTAAGRPRAAASRRWDSVRIDQCSTSTVARLVGLPEDRVGRVGREAVARIGGHDLADQPTSEEGRTQRAEAGHDEGEARVGAPELAGQLPGGRRPTAVPHHHEDRVARAARCRRPHPPAWSRPGLPRGVAGVTKPVRVGDAVAKSLVQLIFDPTQT